MWGLGERVGEDEDEVLHRAVLAGRLKDVEALLRGGADVNARNRAGDTALHLACSFVAGGLPANAPQRSKLQLALIHAGAMFSRRDNEGRTALHVGLMSKFHVSASVVDALLGLPGANVNATDNAGCTALHYAAAAGVSNVRNLLQNKKHRTLVRLDLVNSAGRTALDCACSAEVAELLTAPGALWEKYDAARDPAPIDAAGRTELHIAVLEGGLKDVEVQLRRSGREGVDAQDRAGMTPLHLACTYRPEDVGNTERLRVKSKVVRMLCDVSPSFDVRDANGRTALMFSCQNGHEACCASASCRGRTSPRRWSTRCWASPAPT